MFVTSRQIVRIGTFVNNDIPGPRFVETIVQAWYSQEGEPIVFFGLPRVSQAIGERSAGWMKSESRRPALTVGADPAKVRPRVVTEPRQTVPGLFALTDTT